MKIAAIILTLGLTLSGSVALAWNQALSGSIKLTTEGVDVPLIRPTPYPSVEGDPFQKDFGIRRWLRPSGSEQEAAGTVLAESQKWLDMYGAYGTFGRGEDVFTNLAANWRRSHKGR
jgi:hypothetical protein